MPESFKVLVKEMKSLCLNVELERPRSCKPIDVDADEIEDYSADQALLRRRDAARLMHKKTEDEEANAIDAAATCRAGTT